MAGKGKEGGAGKRSTRDTSAAIDKPRASKRKNKTTSKDKNSSDAALPKVGKSEVGGNKGGSLH